MTNFFSSTKARKFCLEPASRIFAGHLTRLNRQPDHQTREYVSVRTCFHTPSFRRLRAAFCGFAAAAALAATPLPSLAGGNTYLLKPESPTPGFMLMENMQGNCPDGSMTISGAGSRLAGQISMQTFSTKKTEVLAFSGAKPSVLKESTLSDITITTTRIGDKVETNTENGALTGCTVLIERNNGGWTKNLIGAVPNEAQLKELKAPYSDGDESYPDGPVKVGTKWQINASTLAKLLGWDAQEISPESESSMTFERIESINGDRCAVISVSPLLISGTKEFDGKAMRFRLDGHGIIYRSLSGYFDAKSMIEGTMTLDRQPAPGETDVAFNMTIPLTISTTAQRIDR